MRKDENLLDNIQRSAFNYILMRSHPETGLIADTSRQGSPASIAAVGFALSTYPVAVERGWITRQEAVCRTLKTIRFFCDGPPGASFEAIGHKGFCYHFLDMHNGSRAWNCEVSFIDTALLLAGIIMTATYFRRRTRQECEIRRLADFFYHRIEWKWALNEGETLALCWTPEQGFSSYRWIGYNEGLILYLLGLGSPTSPLDIQDYKMWLSSYQWKRFYGIEYLHAGPLFVHHFSHAWLDFRGIQDDYMRERGSDYFENSRLASRIQSLYAAENVKGFRGYETNCWGFSACDGPANLTYKAGGKLYRGRGYAARGAPACLDDGTIAPASIVASLPFAPDLSLKALKYIGTKYPDVMKNYSFTSSFNPTAASPTGGIWISDGYYGIDQGIIVLMIENYRSRFIWKLTRQNKYLRKGLLRAGFRGGWLAE